MIYDLFAGNMDSLPSPKTTGVIFQCSWRWKTGAADLLFLSEDGHLKIFDNTPTVNFAIHVNVVIVEVKIRFTCEYV